MIKCRRTIVILTGAIGKTCRALMVWQWVLGHRRSPSARLVMLVRQTSQGTLRMVCDKQRIEKLLSEPGISSIIEIACFCFAGFKLPDQLTVLKEILHTFALWTGLKVSYTKTVMVPINTSDSKMDSLAEILGCQKESPPFTYLGLPLGNTKPKIQEFLPLIHKMDMRLMSTSSLLRQVGRLEMVNAVFSSSTVFHNATLKLHKGVIHKWIRIENIVCGVTQDGMRGNHQRSHGLCSVYQRRKGV